MGDLHQSYEILAGIDLQRDGGVFFELRCIRLFSQHFAAVVRYADKGTVFGLLAQPGQVIQIFGAKTVHLRLKAGQSACFCCPGIDLVNLPAWDAPFLVQFFSQSHFSPP